MPPIYSFLPVLSPPSTQSCAQTPLTQFILSVESKNLFYFPFSGKFFLPSPNEIYSISSSQEKSFPFLWGVDCSMAIFYLTANISECITYFSFWVWVSSLRMIFFPSSIHLPLNSMRSLFLYSSVIIHWVNVQHFLYPVIELGIPRLFSISCYYEYSCYKHSWTNAFW